MEPENTSRIQTALESLDGLADSWVNLGHPRLSVVECAEQLRGLRQIIAQALIADPRAAARLAVPAGPDPLTEALKAYRAAHADLPGDGELGWIDDLQKRRRRYAEAINTLLAAALLDPSGGTPETGGTP